ncbi:hypothetical protein, partial [Corynebacterium diphtheriae]|uniref:hypothetical protein n=1 Tax=Corynebacterium diphtheriae TaxID=1717 RepID=UPI000D485569
DRIYKIPLIDGLKFSDATPIKAENFEKTRNYACLIYTSHATDDQTREKLRNHRLIKKTNKRKHLLFVVRAYQMSDYTSIRVSVGS